MSIRAPQNRLQNVSTCRIPLNVSALPPATNAGDLCVILYKNLSHNNNFINFS